MTPRRIVWRLRLASSPAEAYRMLATTEGREAFWADEAPEVDGVIHFRFVNGARTRSAIVRAEPPLRFEIDYFGARVRFLLTPLDGGTDLELETTGVRDEEWDDVLPGWVSVLLQLKAALDHGVDLRSHDPSRTWDQRYVDQ